MRRGPPAWVGRLSWLQHALLLPHPVSCPVTEGHADHPGACAVAGVLGRPRIPCLPVFHGITAGCLLRGFIGSI